MRTFVGKERVVKKSRFTDEQIAFALKQQELATALSGFFWPRAAR
jgi:hypothetical protein